MILLYYDVLILSQSGRQTVQSCCQNDAAKLHQFLSNYPVPVTQRLASWPRFGLVSDLILYAWYVSNTMSVMWYFLKHASTLGMKSISAYSANVLVILGGNVLVRAEPSTIMTSVTGSTTGSGTLLSRTAASCGRHGTTLHHLAMLEFAYSCVGRTRVDCILCSGWKWTFFENSWQCSFSTFSFAIVWSFSCWKKSIFVFLISA